MFPKFSIIIPVYNAEKYLRSALDSVLTQTYTNWECICVDDGSTDTSPSILDEYANRDERLRVIHQHNQGVAVARNVGLEAAKGKWITWLDADDMYAPWRLEEAAEIISSTSPDLIRFRTVMGGAEGRADYVRRPSHLMEGDVAERWLWNVFIPLGMVWATVVRREMWDGVRFVPGMRIKEEFPVCARLALRARRIVRSESQAYYYRQTAGSAMQSVRRADDCLRLLQAVRDFVLEYPELTHVARERIRMHCECDVIDWVLKRNGDRVRARDIFAVYNKLKEQSVFACKSIQQKRYRLAMWWWRTTGQIWQIELTGRLVRLCGMLRSSR